MRNRIYIYALLLAGLIICVASENIFAGGVEMPGDLGTGNAGSSSSPGSVDGSHATKWMKYYRAKNNGTMYTSSEPMPIVPQYRGAVVNGYPEPTEPPYISAECHNSNSSADGVWILGNVTSGKVPFNDYLYSTYDTIGGNKNLNDIWSAFATPKLVDGHKTTYLENNHYGIYRTGPSDEMQYNTISSQNIDLSNISWGGTSSVSTMYYGTKSGDTYTDVRAYTTNSTSIAGGVKDIVDEYINFMINSGKYSEEDIETAKGYSNYNDAYNKLIKSKGIYAFCSYPEAADTPLQAKVSLTVDGTQIESGWDESNVSTSITVHSSPISISTDFDFKRGVESPNMAFKASIVRLNEKSYDHDFTMTSSELNNQEKKVQNISLSVGANLVCSSVKHPEKISGGDNSNRSKNKEAKACVTVVYEPYVAAIDSKTTLTAYGILKEESDPDANGELDLGSVPYGAGAISATWSYNLSSSSRCIESYFNGTRCSSNNPSIKSNFKVNYKRSGVVYNDSNYNDQSVTLSYSDYSSSDGVIGANTKNYNLLPGETIKETQGISHKSGVRTDGTPATNAKEESSSMTLKATAEDAICGLNNLPFGLGNPVNYGRMTVVKNKNRTGRRTYVYGDNLVDGNSTWSDAGDIWLKPTDTVQLSYEACIGEQIQKDKDSGDKKWNDSIATEYNAVLTVGTSNDALDDTHYKGIGGAVDADSINNKNIVANEKIGDTIKEHISNDYQFVGQDNAAYSDEEDVGYLGQTITNDFGNISSDIHATMKIPYNYILEPEISAGTKEIVTLGNENTFTISVKNPEVRINTKVQNDAYQTDVKPGTKATYLKFVAKTDTSASVLASLNGQFISGDKTGDIASTLSGIDFKNPSGGNITIPRSGKVDEETVKVSADESDSEYNKLCVAVAVYPADSHNQGGAKEIKEKDDQSAALSDSIDGGYTRIAVACKTVGKYPTTSVEGNGIVAGGSVTGAYTEYNNRYFGSWTEYSLIANSVQNFASGASVAYTNPQTSINATAAWNLGGLNKEYFDSPQTLGNMSDNVGLRDEAEASLRASQMQSFVDDVKSTFFAGTPGGSEAIMQFKDSKTFINTNFDSDVIIGTELAGDINSKANEGMVLIYSNKNIKISNEVQYLKAVLIADGIVDTCSEADRGGDNGQLLDYCYNPLVINGVVFSNGDIALDRVYGGGSTDGMNLDSNTLIQRSEIFNFNPEIVEWGYNYKHKTQPITTTYIEELSTRY